MQAVRALLENAGEDFSGGVGEFGVEEVGDGGGDVDVVDEADFCAAFERGTGGDEGGVHFWVCAEIAVVTEAVLQAGGADEFFAERGCGDAVTIGCDEDEVGHARVGFGGGESVSRELVWFENVGDTRFALEQIEDLLAIGVARGGIGEVDHADASFGDELHARFGDAIGGAEFQQAGISKDGVWMEDIGDACEAVVGSDDDGGVGAEACCVDGVDELPDV